MNLLNINNITINKDFIESIEIFNKDYTVNKETSPDESFYVVGFYNNVSNEFKLDYSRERVPFHVFLSVNQICDLNVSSKVELKNKLKDVLKDWFYFNDYDFQDSYDNKIFTMYENYGNYKVLIRERFLKEVYITMASGKEHKFYKRKDIEIILNEFKNISQIKIEE